MFNKVKILIIEDEAIIGQDLRFRVKNMGYDVLQVATSPEEALHSLNHHEPDLLISDINLDSEIDGIELASVINKSHNLPIIFLTSYHDKSLRERAKSVKPSAYMLKPYKEKEIEIAIEMALNNYSHQQEPTLEDTLENTLRDAMPIGLYGDQKEAQDHALGNALSINDSLFLKKDTHYERVRYDDIYWLEADNNYTEIHTNKESYVYSTVLKKVESALPSDLFIRVHRSYVINKNCITGFEGNSILIHNKRIPVSKPHREMVFSWFKTL